VWSKRSKIKAFESEVGAKLGANFGFGCQARKRKATLSGAFLVAGAGFEQTSATAYQFVEIHALG
jgi:hypothetical protein